MRRWTLPLSGNSDDHSRRVTRRQLKVLRAVLLTVALLAIVLGAALRWETRVARPSWNSDEGISFLMISCRGSSYGTEVRAGSPLYGAWVPASRWQELIDPQGEFCPGAIRHDLTYADVHPPLYFWLLHVWTLLFGRELAATMALNVVLFGATAALLHRFARRTLASRLEAAAVTTVFCMNPFAIKAATEFRPYTLLALVTVAYADAIAACTRRRSVGRREYAVLAVAAAAGVLSHHLFWFVIAGSLPYALVRLRWRHDGLARLWRGAVAILTGTVLGAVVIFPLFEQARSRGPRTASGDAARRWSVFTKQFDTFYQWAASIPPAWAVAAAVIGVAAALALHRWARVPRTARRFTPPGADAIVLVAATATALALQYAAGLSPTHAIGTKYLASIWPLAAFVPVLMARALGPARHAALIALCLLLLARGGEQFPASGLHMLSPHLLKPLPTVVDQVGRLHWPRLLSRMDPNTQVFVANQGELLRRTDWLETQPPWFYAGCSASTSSARKRTELLARIGQTYEVAAQKEAGKCWTLYRLRAHKKSGKGRRRDP